MSASAPIQAGDPRWLDDAQQRAWRNLAAVMVKLPAALEADISARPGSATSSTSCSPPLSEAPERTLRMNELAELSSGSPP